MIQKAERSIVCMFRGDQSARPEGRTHRESRTCRRVGGVLRCDRRREGRRLPRIPNADCKRRDAVVQLTSELNFERVEAGSWTASPPWLDCGRSLGLKVPDRLNMDKRRSSGPQKVSPLIRRSSLPTSSTSASSSSLRTSFILVTNSRAWFKTASLSLYPSVTPYWTVSLALLASHR